MSVIVRAHADGPPILYTKGADTNILALIDADWADSERGQAIMYSTQQYLSQYSSYGLRTLCLAKRVLDEHEYREWAELQAEAETDIDNRDQLLYESALRIEHNLQLLGVTGIEDRLQDGVPECIQALRHAGIKVWVLTGDKIETAVNIAYASRLFSPGMELVQLSARTMVCHVSSAHTFVHALPGRLC
jgi:phospholipid-translocating ATPase